MLRENYRNVREKIAHSLTGYVCGQCKCSNSCGWEKPEMQPTCECYQVAGEIVGWVTDDLQNRFRSVAEANS